MSGPVTLRTIKIENEVDLKIWKPTYIEKCGNSDLPSICLDHILIYKGLPTCGNSPLPCTPYFNTKLRQLVPGNLGKGFYLLK